ncbi:ATP-dependent RNA helicase dbp10 [Yamadazyma tenuis]|uniref:ATP-dependent RNA helicase DBP10 n=1 Tax=Candida tenuis (strain ATCC 10573 / BCRC 21748 / CBS 615 / JCM 9827 / NBRC 10315 / NRRL Y-1498 / VKM Y-70) TaxID=590646 RepID=G3B3P5_CANTC|nr:DEAD-domain-containing protein [Yamadazyma tenuis ATCC 10573]EGV64202.1 DEAD-domain-containing protein [Yamadazyma tenuis ATCC 10573]WEJ96133.1 ATP-dependent RNA helicase dbp10 [Yamadazyma tenuis]
MSDDEYDITKSLALNLESSDDSGTDGEGEVPVLRGKRAVKKLKTNSTEAFPSLELSDDEEENDKTSGADAIASYFVSNNPAVKKAKSGTFQSFGFSKFLIGNIIKKGFKQPTPIQRKAIPLIMDSRDVVGMARTGSGKTAAFTLPMVEKLKAHSAKSGSRAIILSPSRELALQTYKQVKEFSHRTDLRIMLLVGGDSLDDQFSAMMTNPDIIIATPGRFMHLKIEMDLNLKSIEYIVFDEADRLFELGFAEQLNELIAGLPASRQTLLFSATLPKSLVEFAKAGLSNPTLVRLDADSKISDQLEMAFVTTKRNEREANLLYLLQEVIKMPLPTQEEIKKMNDMNKRNDESDEEEAAAAADDNKKRKKFKKERLPPANVLPSKYSTMVFVPTKHHVEYITSLLRSCGYLVSYIYGTLDQTARKQQLYQFRIGLTTIMVVTDVAARGIDIPILANVINFTLPSSSKIFIHRVGRTARAGNKGWAYSIVNEKELPYLLDLEIFLGKKILTTSLHESKVKLLKERMGDRYQEPKLSFTERLVLGSAPRAELENCQEVYEGVLKHNYDLKLIKDVSIKGEKLFYRTRQPASNESVKRSKNMVEHQLWDEQHLLFGPNVEKEKQDFLDKLANRHSKETVFEFNKKEKEKDENSLAGFMLKRRRQLAPIQRKAKERRELVEKEKLAGLSHNIEDEILNKKSNDDGVNQEDLDFFEDGDEVLGQKYKPKKTFKDPQFYMSHYASASDIQDKQLSLGNSFANSASNATFDLDNDDKSQVHSQVYKWDSKKGNYVNSRSTDKKYIISESGQRIPATFKSGRFDEWKKQNPTRSNEDPMNNLGNKKFKHKQSKSPKMPDKFRDNYEKQVKKVEKAVEGGKSVKGYHKAGPQQELRTTEQIRKNRLLHDKKRAKNARPTKRR